MRIARLLRFRLRTLLTLVTVISVILGWYVVNARLYTAEIAAAKAWNGDPSDSSVLLGPPTGRFTDFVGITVFAYTKWHGPAWLRKPLMAIGPPVLDRIVYIGLDSPEYGDGEIPKFASFPDVKLVLLIRHQMSAEGRKRIREHCPSARIVYADPTDREAVPSAAGDAPAVSKNARATLESLRPPRMLVDEPDGTTRPLGGTDLSDYWKDL